MAKQSTTIAMLKAMPDGYKTGGFEFAIKTNKGCKPVGKDYWHTVKICDETGEMLVDVNVGKKYNPIATASIRIITCKVQDAELHNIPIKKLYTDEYILPIVIGEPEPFVPTLGDLIVRGKIKCLLVSRMFDGEMSVGVMDAILEIAQCEKMKEIIDEIIRG